uniref:SET domain-containing protein n=2 Tax=Coccolithus braarudii TaxID=221442 RepID=A0A7S0L0H8_9EUKA|mmetsp:Transcript_12349/g.26683  ORF Transcript_12349/g.26683 Transcript_12349/m.26683 type:complete len:103 (+) Transcript_12349:141-449(+)
MERRTSGAYIMTLGDSWVLDGEDETRSAWTRFVNHSRRKANCASYFLVVSPTEESRYTLNSVYLEATRDISAGEELLIDYGPEYWDSRVGKWAPTRFAIDYL